MFLVFVKRLALYFVWNLSGFSKSILLYSPVTFWERCKEGSYEIQGYLKLKDAILKWSFYHKASLFFIFITLAFFIHTLTESTDWYSHSPNDYHYNLDYGKCQQLTFYWLWLVSIYCQTVGYFAIHACKVLLIGFNY